MIMILNRNIKSRDDIIPALYSGSSTSRSRYYRLQDPLQAPNNDHATSPIHPPTRSNNFVDDSPAEFPAYCDTQNGYCPHLLAALFVRNIFLVNRREDPGIHLVRCRCQTKQIFRSVGYVLCTVIVMLQQSVHPLGIKQAGSNASLDRFAYFFR